MVADNGSGRRQQTRMAREKQRTTTGKVGSGRQTTMALSIRDGEDNVVFDDQVANNDGIKHKGWRRQCCFQRRHDDTAWSKLLFYGLANIGGFCLCKQPSSPRVKILTPQST
jgi:hypothetical protein